MLRFFKFHVLCIQHAWRGCWTRANELAALLGGGFLAAILWFSSPALRERGMIEAPSTIWGAAIYTAISTAACVILAFAVIFVGRLLVAPVRLYWAERDKAETLLKKEASKPRIKLSYAKPETRNLGGGSRATYLYATNEGKTDVAGAQVKIEESLFRRMGSDTWENTSILVRHNMSWGDKADDDSQKYAPIQLASGSEIIDFIEGPINITNRSTGQTFIGFRIRIDPRLWRNVNPIFVEAGTYKFGMQISALDAERDNLSLLVDWNGKQLVIRSDQEPGQVLETCEVPTI
jgi:hypothetical protein